MRFPNREIVEQVRKNYPAGSRVRLIRMEDPQAPPVGTEGTVTGVDDAGSIMVDWDNGSGLNVVYGEDVVTKICPSCGKPLTGHPAVSRRDNKTLICSACGTREALADFGIDEGDQEQIIEELYGQKDSE